MDYQKKVLGAWLGKAAGGTLGQPYEGSAGPLRLSYYDPVPTGMIANDDLDAQVVYGCKLAGEWNGEISRHRIAAVWPSCVNNPCDEYGVAIRNLALGLTPPWTGKYDNFFTAGMGAAIRSEIWACLAPGNPELAAEFAAEDGCVDHCGDGLYAEQFLAAMESCAFTCTDREVILRRSLDLLPEASRLRTALEDTRRRCMESGDPAVVREKVMARYGSENFTDVCMNLPAIVAGFLLGGGEFGRSICIAVNFGNDADCTGASLGALMGILDPDGIEERFLAPIGHDLVISEGIRGIDAPGTLEEFAGLICGLRDKVFLGDRTTPDPGDWRRFEIPFRVAELRPFFTADYRKFPVEMPEKVREVRVSGNLIELDFTGLADNTLQLWETVFRLESDRRILLVVNTPAFVMVWVDGVLRFGRETGAMIPAFHRTPMNQRCELELAAGEHRLRFGVAPAFAGMTKAPLLFGVAGMDCHWLPRAFHGRS